VKPGCLTQRDLFKWQKRPIQVAKETYSCGKRDLFLVCADAMRGPRRLRLRRDREEEEEEEEAGLALGTWRSETVGPPPLARPPPGPRAPIF